jgi:phenylalanyl-tRNA synthetase alpha chain
MTDAAENAVLSYLSTSSDAIIEDTYPWSEELKLDHLSVIGAIKSLLPDDYITSEDLSTQFYSIEKEGESILADGSQEILVLKALNETGRLSVADLQAKVGNDVAKIGMGNCMKSKWIQKEGTDLVPTKSMDQVQDEVQEALKALKAKDFAIDAVEDKVSLVLGLRFTLRCKKGTYANLSCPSLSCCSGYASLETTKTCKT